MKAILNLQSTKFFLLKTSACSQIKELYKHQMKSPPSRVKFQNYKMICNQSKTNYIKNKNPQNTPTKNWKIELKFQKNKKIQEKMLIKKIYKNNQKLQNNLSLKYVLKYLIMPPKQNQNLSKKTLSYYLINLRKPINTSHKNNQMNKSLTSKKNSRTN